MNDDVKRMAEHIAEEICHSFADVTRDEGVTLHEASVIDAYGSDTERFAARELDTDLRWQDVPDHLIESHSDTLCFVDPKGFRYYLPAYMIWALRHFRTSDSFSVDHVIYSLIISEGFYKKKKLEDAHREWKLERFEVFTDEQAKMICRFLRFMAEQKNFVDAEKASTALDQYWDKFCEPAVFTKR